MLAKFPNAGISITSEATPQTSGSFEVTVAGELVSGPYRKTSTNDITQARKTAPCPFKPWKTPPARKTA